MTEQAMPQPQSSTGLTPLTEMGAEDRYKGEDGGLYGGGRNDPPEGRLKLALAAAAQVQPLDPAGRPDPERGAIVVLSIGMSNTTQSFSRFVDLAGQDPQVSKRVRLVDGAQNGRDGLDWAYADDFFTAPHNEPWHPWKRLAGRMAGVPVTPVQVQAAWIKLARKGPATLGEFPDHARALYGDFLLTALRLKRTFPNLRLAYLSSRTYAGYATTRLNPEPYAYEGAFAARWAIRDQMAGRAELNCDPARDHVRAPVMLWGPYLWGDGQRPRKADGLVWTAEDMEADGTHPSDAGRRKVAEMLLKFFKTDPTTRTWFVA